MWYDQLKKAWDENPLAVLTTMSMAAGAAAKVIDAVSARKGRNAYAKQVKYRTSRRK